MLEDLKADICIIGGGAGGLYTAAAAAQMGADVVLIEKGAMGGDCLNWGCVPSKALLAAANVAQAVRGAGPFGVSAGGFSVDPVGVHGHVHGAIAAIAPHDSAERFEGLGVRIIHAPARFLGAREVEAGNFRVRARRFVVATGSSPLVPDVAGLDQIRFFTNETIFDLRETPHHLIVIGGGPIGMELAQAHRRLGAQVSVLELATVMAADDPELVAVLRARFAAEGIGIREGAAVKRVEAAGDQIRVVFDENVAETSIQGSHLLVAAGRRPTVAGLGLDAAGITHTERGIDVDARLRTTNKRVFAIGDVTGGLQFTHVAGYHAGIVIRNALFRIPARANTRAMPWVTFTSPEVAQVGMTEKAAVRDGIAHKVLRAPFEDNDRAITELAGEGLVKAVVTPKGRILGAGIAGPAAGELIQTWVLAMSKNLKVGAVAGMVAPYPTLGEANKRAAGAFYTPLLFGDRTKKIVRFLRHFG